MNLQAGLLLRQQEFDPNNTAARSYNDNRKALTKNMFQIFII